MPQVTAETPKADLTIQGLTFQYSTPYVPGPVELTEGEASTLNQVRGENIRNNFASTIRKARESAYRQANSLKEDDKIPEGAELPPAEMTEELRTAFAEYDAEYEFGVRKASTGPRVPVDPVEREAYRIATDQIKVALKSKGIKVSTVTDEQMESLIKQLLEANPLIREEAKRRVDAVSSLATSDILSSLDAAQAA